MIEESYANINSIKYNSEDPPSKIALIIGGGIGDFLHYIVRIDDFLQKTKYHREEITLYVESTNPSQVTEMFLACLPEFNFRFIPKAIHWTRTNPLLIPNRVIDQINRPAYLYVKAQGHQVIEDWFLPFKCHEYLINTQRLFPLTKPVHSETTNKMKIMISARNKGFLWWPSKEASEVITEILTEDYEVNYFGTIDENPDWIDNFITTDNVKCALQISLAADLFIGTDTGFATIRELLGLPNIYCINEYWYNELMVPYNYWSSDFAQSKSKFAFNINDFKKILVSFDNDVNPAKIKNNTLITHKQNELLFENLIKLGD